MQANSPGSYLTEEDVSNGAVDVLFGGIATVNHQSVHELHSLGSLTAKLARDNYFATLRRAEGIIIHFGNSGIETIGSTYVIPRQQHTSAPIVILLLLQHPLLSYSYFGTHSNLTLTLAPDSMMNLRTP